MGVIVDTGDKVADIEMLIFGPNIFHPKARNLHQKIVLQQKTQIAK